MSTRLEIGGSPTTVRAHNRRILLLHLLRYQPVSRVRLARLCRLSSTTVTNLVAELMAQGVVDEIGTDIVAARSGAGRPPLALRLSPKSRFALGVHIGVRTVRLAVVDLQGTMLANEVFALNPAWSPEEAMKTVVERSRALLRGARLPNDGANIVGVGVGAAGLVDWETGVNVHAPNLGWQNVPIRDYMADQLGLPAVVDNNVRCMVLAESLFGAGRHHHAIAFVHSRVGVGAGLVVGGQLYRGSGYGAGEIGHWTMLPTGGAPCRCGNCGCLETLINEPAIVALAREIEPNIGAEAERPIVAIFEAARAGHTAMQAMLEDRSRYVGIALANLVNVLNPELILLSGLLYEGFDLMHPVIEATMRQHAFGGLGNKVQVLPTTFGLHSAEIGAASLAFDSFFLESANHHE